MPAELHAASSELNIVREYTAAATQPVADWSTTPMRNEDGSETMFDREMMRLLPGLDASCETFIER